MGNPRRRTKSKKQEWPYVRFSERENSWMVDARTKNGGSRRFFGTKTEAQTYAQQCRTQKTNAGTASFGNSELARYGWSIQRAIDFAIAHLRAQEKSIGVGDAMDELIASRRATGRSERLVPLFDGAELLRQLPRKRRILCTVGGTGTFNFWQSAAKRGSPL